MTELRDALAKSIIDDVIELEGEARIAQLDRRCAGDLPLRRRVEELLAAIEADDAFLSAPSVGIGTAPGDALSFESPSEQVGPYRLLELIGEGGFGSIFLAEQSSPLRRRVALKLIKPGMDSRQVIARFEAERQALALMDHPNIAKVFDAGATDRGRPYMAMELVHGEPVTRYCDREELSVRQRLHLFREICSAVQHAHQKGVIHRDLKPSNVLVTVSDGVPVPKVIDFGVAKAIAAPLSEQTMLTGMHQLIGTPEYMSPEQADLSGVDIDTRSDVYALGVLLYELLTGVTPFDGNRLRSAPFAEIQRVLQAEEPPRPSLRLASSSSHAIRMKTSQDNGDGSGGDSRSSSVVEISRRRRSEPVLLTRTLRGDLDWIVMKCLDKDRNRRYQTVAALGEDIGRYLDHQPVLAMPPSRRYRLHKFVQRHRTGVLAGSLVLLALGVGLGAALYGLGAAREQRDAARLAQEGEKRQRVSAERVAAFMGDMLAGAGPEIAAGRDTTLLRSFLERSVERLEHGELSDAPEAEADLWITIANVYRTIGDALKAARALEPLGAELSAAVLGSDRLCERYLDSKSMLLSALSRFDESTDAFGKLIEVRRRMFGARDHRVASALAGIAANLISQGRLENSIDTLLEALEIAEASGDDATLANVLTNLAEPLGALGRYNEAAETAQRALDHGRKAFPGDHPHVADAINNLAAALHAMRGHQDRVLELMRESVEMKRRLYPDGHPHLGISLHNLALALQENGDLQEAERRYSEALAVLRRYGPARDDDRAATLVNFCGLLGRLGKHDRREALACEALEICERLYPEGHAITSFALLNLGASLHNRGRHDESLEIILRAEQMQRRILGPTHPQLANSLSAAGAVLYEMRRFEEALPYLEEALSIRSARSKADPTSHAAALADLAAALVETGSLASAREAEPLGREALEIGRKVLPPEDWRLSNMESIWGSALVTCAALDLAATMENRLATLCEAESLLEGSLQALESASDRIPVARRSRILSDAADRLSRLYVARDSLATGAVGTTTEDPWRTKTQANSERQ